MIDEHDRDVLRDLARRVAEIAALPVMDERRTMWRRHNRLERVRPLIMVFPEGSWRELLPATDLTCRDEDARRIEMSLRQRIYTFEHLRDDQVIERTWFVPVCINNSGWGLEPRYHDASTATGAWGFDPVIKTAADLDRLRYPQISVDAEQSQRDLARAQELLGDLLDVRQRGVWRLSFHLMSVYSRLRGLEQVMIDMYDHPAMLQRAMLFLTEGYERMVQQYVDLNLLSLNNDGSYHSSGGVGWSSELPRTGFDGVHVRPCDIWASAETQEMAHVSPAQHIEFAMQYEKRLLAPFGLNGYGCCENLALKLDYVLSMANMRRVSVSPFADVERCAEQLGRKAIFSWKPHPAHLADFFDAAMIRDYIRRTLDVTRNNVVELALKDTHTCGNRPERFTAWTEIARALALEYA